MVGDVSLASSTVRNDSGYAASTYNASDNKYNNESSSTGQH